MYCIRCVDEDMLFVSVIVVWMFFVLFFFFKQKTAYEMRISDWSSDVCSSDLAAMTGMIDEIAFVPERMRAAAAGGFSTATDLADWLVREAGVPFREAHHITGRAVKAAEDAGVMLPDLPLETLTAIDARLDGRVYDVLSV